MRLRSRSCAATTHINGQESCRWVANLWRICWESCWELASKWIESKRIGRIRDKNHQLTFELDDIISQGWYLSFFKEFIFLDQINFFNKKEIFHIPFLVLKFYWIEFKLKSNIQFTFWKNKCILKAPEYNSRNCQN